MLSEDVTAQLLAALRGNCSESVDSREQVRAALSGAATAARGGGLTGEQFVIWLKQVWEQLMEEGTLPQSVDQARVRDAVISSAIRAYYVQ